MSLLWIVLSCMLLLPLCSCQVVSGTSVEITPVAVVQPNEYRFINGTNNNLQHPTWGAANSVMVPHFYDLVQDPNFKTRIPNPRTVASTLFSQPATGNTRGLNLFFLNFISLCQTDVGSIGAARVTDSYPAPIGDPTYDPKCSGNATITFRRFITVPTKRQLIDGDGEVTYDLRLNPQTPNFDMEDAYKWYQGSDSQHRTFVGGKLKGTQTWLTGNYINLWNAPWLDVFVREHNRLAEVFQARDPSASDDQLFQLARKWVIAIGQKIFSRDYAAALLGRPLTPYVGYDPNLESNTDLFGCLLLRYGHYEITPYLPLMSDRDRFDKIWFIKDQFFSPTVTPTDFTNYIRGAIFTPGMEIGTGAYSDVRGNVMGNDVIALDILRSREIGFPNYNAMRLAYNLSEVASFSEFTDDVALATKLQSLYTNISNMDAYIGAVLEKHVPGASVGPLMQAALLNHFERVRNSDRFWFEAPGMFTDAERTEIFGTGPIDLITRNYPPLANLLDSGIKNLFFLPQRQINATVTLFPLTDLDSSTWQTLDLGSNYRLSWSTTTYESEDAIEFIVQVKTAGWVGLGFKADENTMKNADIVILRDLYGNTTAPGVPPFEARDSYALDVGPPVSDEEMGGTNDVTPISFQYINGVKVFRFKRRWQTNDPWDKPLDKGIANKVIFAFNAETLDLVYHGPARSSSARINFNKNEVKLVKISVAFLIIAAVLCGLSTLYAAAVVFCIIKYQSFFKHISQKFCFLICCGFILGYIAVLLIVQDTPNDSICLAFIWFLGFSFVLVYGAVFLKAARLWQIFRSLKTAEKTGKQTVPLTDNKLMGVLGVFITLEFTFLLIWSLVDPLKAKTVVVENGTEKNLKCISDSKGWWITFVVWKLVVMLCGSFFVVELRDKKDTLSESKRVIFSIMMTFFATLISCILGFFLADRTVTVEIALILFTVLFVYNLNGVLLFLPILLGIAKGNEGSTNIFSPSPYSAGHVTATGSGQI